MLAADIRNQLTNDANHYLEDIDVFDQLASTQQVLIDRCRSYSAWQFLLAKSQTNGFGRQGHFWQAGEEQISFSIRGRIELEVSSIGLLSLLASVSVRDVLTSLGLSQVMLKWPNDVLVDGRKICGILISVVQATQNKFDIVLGIGLNRVRLPEQITSNGLATTSLSETLDYLPSISVIVAELLNTWFKRLSLLKSVEGCEMIVHEWQKYATWQNETVSIIRDNQKIDGVLRGVTMDGRLRLATKLGEQVFSVGEVHLRPLE